MTVKGEGGSKYPNFLPRGLLTTLRTDIDCVHCYDDAFFGLPIDQVRTFAQYIGIHALA